MTLIQLTNSTKENFKKTKAIHTLISSPRFIEAYNTALPKEQELISSYIKNKSKIDILKWLYKETGYIPVYKLRQLSQRYGIKNYNRLTPNRLLGQLKSLLTEEEILSLIYE